MTIRRRKCRKPTQNTYTNKKTTFAVVTVSTCLTGWDQPGDTVNCTPGIATSQFFLLESSSMDHLEKLYSKLQDLRQQLEKLEIDETEKIRVKRIGADMGDDFRENEGAKLVMEDHNLLHLRIFKLKEEIYLTKKQIARLRFQNGNS